MEMDRDRASKQTEAYEHMINDRQQDTEEGEQVPAAS